MKIIDYISYFNEIISQEINDLHWDGLTGDFRKYAEIALLLSNSQEEFTQAMFEYYQKEDLAWEDWDQVEGWGQFYYQIKLRLDAKFDEVNIL